MDDEWQRSSRRHDVTHRQDRQDHRLLWALTATIALSGCPAENGDPFDATATSASSRANGHEVVANKHSPGEHHRELGDPLPSLSALSGSSGSSGSSAF